MLYVILSWQTTGDLQIGRDSFSTARTCEYTELQRRESEITYTLPVRHGSVQLQLTNSTTWQQIVYIFHVCQQV